MLIKTPFQLLQIVSLLASWSVTDFDSAMQEQAPLLNQRLRPSAHAYAQLCATQSYYLS